MFFFLHPFEDGNGRIHRFLIHNILARRKFTPAGIIFPVSASMLKNLADYDHTGVSGWAASSNTVVVMPSNSIPVAAGSDVHSEVASTWDW